LRGRPVAIVPMETDYTMAIAASPEAKAYGVKTGTGILEAMGTGLAGSGMIPSAIHAGEPAWDRSATRATRERSRPQARK
jgi:hypothetical protein